MTPSEYSANGNALLIDHPIGGRRAAAHVFDLPDGGVAWADSGWSDLAHPGRPFHVQRCNLKYSSRWGWLDDIDDGELMISPLDCEPDGDREIARRQIEYVLGIARSGP